jgi:hypothetical protein
LIVEDHVGWISKEVAEEIDVRIKSRQKYQKYLGPWESVFGTTKFLIYFFGCTTEHRFLPNED